MKLLQTDATDHRRRFLFQVQRCSIAYLLGHADLVSSLITSRSPRLGPNYFRLSFRGLTCSVILIYYSPPSSGQTKQRIVGLREIVFRIYSGQTDKTSGLVVEWREVE